MTNRRHGLPQPRIFATAKTLGFSSVFECRRYADSGAIKMVPEPDASVCQLI